MHFPLFADDLYDPAEADKYRLKPKDVTESILESATTQPATQPNRPATQPEQATSPFDTTPQARREALPGYVELNDGTILPGLIYTTREKPWSVFEDESKSFRRVPPVVVRQIDAEVVWERDEPDWRWKEEGSDVKVYTGKTYPARMTHYTFTLADGQKITGTVQQPIYVLLDGTDKTVQHILHERDKGPPQTKLAQLIYVKHVYLGEESLDRGKKLATERATSQPVEPPH